MTSASRHSRPERRMRRHDPDRRARLARAAAIVIQRDGVLGLSHRAVAEEADVPLGSTTYHFRGLDALLGAALEWISGEELRILEEWHSAWNLETNLEDALVSLALFYTNDRRAESILEYEVHILAYRRAALTALGTRWERALLDVLTAYVTPLDAQLVVAILDGIMLHGLALDEPLAEEWAREALRRVLPTP
jgi:TetR/AcrR family transcriptional regulator, regulator of biofilm formation and stress response